MRAKSHASQICRQAMMRPATTSSFTAFELAPGALNTGMPRSLILATGMLFTPAPARPTAFRLDGMSPLCMLAERTRIASGSLTSLPI